MRAARRHAERLRLLQTGLQDRCAPVREAAAGLCRAWLDLCKGDVIKLLEDLAVERCPPGKKALATRTYDCAQHRDGATAHVNQERGQMRASAQLVPAPWARRGAWRAHQALRRVCVCGAVRVQGCLTL